MPDFHDLPRPFWVLFAGTLVNRVGGFVLIFLAIYLTEERGLNPAQAGAVVAAYGIGAIGAGPIGGALSDRIGRRPTLVAMQPIAGEIVRKRSRPLVLALASLVLGVGFGLNAWVGTALGYSGAIAVWTIGEILFAPASMSLVADLAPAHLRGRYQGAFAVVFTAAPAVGGYIIAHAGARWLWIGCFATSAAVATGFFMLRRVGSGTP